MKNNKLNAVNIALAGAVGVLGAGVASARGVFFFV